MNTCADRRRPNIAIAARLRSFVARFAAGAARPWRAKALLLAMFAAAPGASRADTVASLLGEFTINQFCAVQLADGSANVHFAIVFGQLPALRELHEADANRDGVTTQEERDAYVSTLAPGIAQKLKLLVDGSAIDLHASKWTSTLPKEQSGFSLRMDIDYTGSIAPAFGETVRTVSFANENFPGRIGWHEIVVEAPAGLEIFDTDAFDTSLTGGLTQALRALPANGPLDERSVHMKVTRGSLPTGAHLLASRDGSAMQSPSVGAPTLEAASPAWLQVQTRKLIGLISAPHVPVHVAAIALLAAMLLGALHALSPGHGKSIVGAYLVGSRGTARHAVFLGLTVTVTHTLVVFALGLATLFASRFILPERVFPILNLASGLLIFGMGLVLLTQRWGTARASWMWGPGGVVRRPHRGNRAGAIPSAREGDHVHANGHPHSHSDSHGHGHEHGAHAHFHEEIPTPHSHVEEEDSPVQALLHSHGGTVHSHLPPGADGAAISWRGLLALGVSGGLLPCPSAMVLLLAAVALNKTLFGLLLVVAFSIGLAVTLSGIGLAFLYARNRFQGRIGTARWPHLLPVLSAASITVLGAALCVGALVANPV